MLKADDARISLYALLDQTRETIFKAVELELAQYNMTAPQVKMLHILNRNGGRTTLNELASGAIRELNSISTLISRMQEKGLVEKEKTSGNERLYVTSTDKGKDIYENTITERSIFLIFDVLSEEEKKQLTSLLVKLQDKARDLLGYDYIPPFLEQGGSSGDNDTDESP